MLGRLDVFGQPKPETCPRESGGRRSAWAVPRRQTFLPPLRSGEEVGNPLPRAGEGWGGGESVRNTRSMRRAGFASPSATMAVNRRGKPRPTHRHPRAVFARAGMTFGLLASGNRRPSPGARLFFFPRLRGKAGMGAEADQECSAYSCAVCPIPTQTLPLKGRASSLLPLQGEGRDGDGVPRRFFTLTPPRGRFAQGWEYCLVASSPTNYNGLMKRHCF